MVWLEEIRKQHTEIEALARDLEQLVGDDRFAKSGVENGVAGS